MISISRQLLLRCPTSGIHAVVIRRHHVFQPVFLASFTFLVGAGFSKEAGAVVIDVGVEEPVAERVDLKCKALRDMAVTQVFAHDGAILGFGQPVVRAAPGPGLRELHAQLLQQACHRVVDVLRTIVPQGQASRSA